MGRTERPLFAESSPSHARTAKSGRAPVRNDQSLDGPHHFLMKRLPNVKTEISLHILPYNMKRVMAVLGTKPLIEAIRA